MKRKNYFFLYRLIMSEVENDYKYYIVKSDTAFKRFKNEILVYPEVLDYQRLVFLSIKDFFTELPYMEVTAESDMEYLYFYFNDMLMMEKKCNSDDFTLYNTSDAMAIASILSYMTSQRV